MTISVKDALAAKGIHPTQEHLQLLETKWAQIQELKGELRDIHVDDADIALRNIAGGDHVG